MTPYIVYFSPRCDEQVLGPMPALKESSPEDDSQADASNTASLYKVPEHVFINPPVMLQVDSTHFHF